MGMMRDCQVVRRRDGTREVMSGLTRLLSSQYQDVRSTASLLLDRASAPPQIADVACASVPGSTAPPSQHPLLPRRTLASRIHNGARGHVEQGCEEFLHFLFLVSSET